MVRSRPDNRCRNPSLNGYSKRSRALRGSAFPPRLFRPKIVLNKKPPLLAEVGVFSYAWYNLGYPALKRQLINKSVKNDPQKNGMKNYPSNKYSIAVFVIFSLLGHLLVMYILALTVPLSFRTPVQPFSAEFVTHNSTFKTPSIKAGKTGQASTEPSRKTPHLNEKKRTSEKTANSAGSPKNFTRPQEHDSVHEPASKPSLTPGDQVLSASSQGTQVNSGPDDSTRNNDTSSHIPLAIDNERGKGPVRNAGEFLATKKEKLTYRISLLKIPVGTAVMEAANNNGELRITIKITSNAVFSAVYPVDDLVETRMIKGNYLLTRVRQSEGSYRGDFGFTLMLREHKAFWVDRLANRYNYQPLPVDDVMDAVSGFYFLRNRDLKVGKSVELHLFDSNEYSPTTIEVLRRERVSLPGGDEVDALVLHPLFKTAGFFRRTGDIMIWLTDDQFRVPVRLETFISLGKVTAELIAAESAPEEYVTEKKVPVNLPDKSNR